MMEWGESDWGGWIMEEPVPARIILGQTQPQCYASNRAAGHGVPLESMWQLGREGDW